MNNGRKQHHIYTVEEKRFFIEYTPGHTYKEIQEEFCRVFNWDITLSQVKGCVKRSGSQTGYTGRFQKGQVPQNKGVKGIRYAGTEKTWFPKGNIPHNTKPVGFESIRNNYKKNQKYVYVKVAEPNEWRMKHLLVWEEHYGKIEKGFNIIFLDGNTLNTDIDNLQMVSKATHAVMNKNSLRYKDKESTEVGINIANLHMEITQSKKRENRC